MGKLFLICFERGKYMYRIKDFYYKGVYNLRGKRLGVVKDIFIDFYKGEIKGLLISNYSIKNKNNYISIEDIVNIDEEILVRDVSQGDGLRLSQVIEMEVIDKFGNIKGIVEDVLIDNEDFSVKGVIISAGVIEKLIHGREIILINRAVLGENYILYLGDPNIIVKNIPHEMSRNEYYKKA